MKANNFIELPEATIVDVVATKGEKVIIKTMTFGESKRVKKSAGWVYKTYQQGFHSFKEK